ncbi:CHAT domain-containing protein [Streptomyces sp. NPDC058964]|uniref:CHAT domain-containing protein n=1 Tax=Streptomyces sp. NPDC058964 TaxID=3346681 RepID=UPI0036AB3995
MAGRAHRGRARAVRAVHRAERRVSVSGMRRAAAELLRWSAEDVPALLLAGVSLLDCHEAAGMPQDLDLALALLDRAERLLPADATDRASLLNLLGTAWIRRWEQRQERRSLDRAVVAFRESARVTPAGPDLGASLSNLGSAVMDRYEHFCVPGDLDEAIAALGSALDQEGRADDSYVPYQLAMAHFARWEARGDTADLAAAATHAAAAETRATGDAASTAKALRLRGRVAAAKSRAGDGTSVPADATEWLRKAAVVAGEVSPQYQAPYLTQLGMHFMDLYEATASLAHLERAGAALADAWEAAGQDDPELPRYLSNVALVMTERARATASQQAMEAALDVHRQALEAGEGTEDEGLIRGRLGTALAESANLVDDTATEAHRADGREGGDAEQSRDEAVRQLERALVQLPGDATEQRASFVLNLGNALLMRYERARNTWLVQGTRDADEPPEVADELARAAERLAEAAGLARDDAAQMLALGNLANAHRYLYARAGDQRHRDRARSAYRQASSSATTPWVALVAAANWGAWAVRNQWWAEVVEAYGRAMDLMELLVDAQSTRHHQELRLRDVHELPAQAAHAWLQLGEPARAASVVERGRLLLWRAAAADRAATQEAAPDEAGPADMAQRSDGDPAAPAFALAPPCASQAPEYQPVAWEAGPARQPHGRELVCPPTGTVLAYIHPCAPEGFLLVVQPDGAVSHRMLPALTRRRVEEQAIRYFESYDHRRRDSAAWERALDELTAWLWEACVGPLLAETTETRGTERLTVVPGGWLSLLPLHAAWRPDRDSPTRRRYALDDRAFAYAPDAASAFGRAHRPPDPAARLFAICDPRPNEAEPLPWATWEVRAAMAQFGNSHTLSGANATESGVLRQVAELGADDVLHAACHAKAEVGAPLHSALLLADGGRLTVGDILAGGFSAGRLAVLSGCETALIGTDLPDEAVGFPGALLRAGFAGVVAGQWAVPEQPATVALLAEFHRNWRRAGEPPAEALRNAQQWVRDSTNGEKNARYPDLFPLPCSGPAGLALWRAARTHTPPCHWAVLSVWGG